MLNVVDAFSKRAYIEPTTGTSAAKVLKAFKKILKRSGKPKRLQTDNGPEFLGDFSKGLQELKIKQTYGQPNRPWNQAIVEKTNFTLASLFTASRTARGKKYRMWWLSDVYQRIEKNYNELSHEALKYKSPLDVEALSPKDWKEMAEDARAALKKRRRLRTQELSVGDKVRIEDAAKRKAALSKGSNPNWSVRLYTIKKVSSPIGAS